MAKTTSIRLNITDDQGTLLGHVELTADELRAAKGSALGAFALVNDIAGQAGIR